MGTTFPPPRPSRGRAAVLAAALAVAIPASGVLATHNPGHAEAADVIATSDGATVEEMRAQLMTLSDENEQLLADNASLLESVTKAEAERDELARGLDRFHELYDALEADRQLLFELRKGIPESRPEAEAQLTRLHSLALLSDPARLGDLVDRVEDAAPSFMDWRFSDFTTTEEATQAYIDSGANAFDSLMTEFRNEVLLSVANRLDGLLTVIDRAR
jgi:hypothetical protein